MGTSEIHLDQGPLDKGHPFGTLGPPDLAGYCCLGRNRLASTVGLSCTLGLVLSLLIYPSYMGDPSQE